MVAVASQPSCLSTEHATWRTQPGRVETSPEPSLHSSACEPSVFTNAGIVHDAKGNLTTNKNGQVFTWDYENLMKTAQNGANTHTYRYDAFRRRVKKELAGGSCVVFAYAGWQVLAEYENGAAPASPTRTFVYGSYIDEPLMMEKGGQKYYYACNALYSATAQTDSVGNVVERYKYEPYGAVTVLNADGSAKADPVKSEFGNPYTFTGRNLDDETRWVKIVNGQSVPQCGLMYYRNRYYDVDLGRFVGRDPLQFDEALPALSFGKELWALKGSARINAFLGINRSKMGDDFPADWPEGRNLYAYSNCGPTLFVDSTGLFCHPPEPNPNCNKFQDGATITTSCVTKCCLKKDLLAYMTFGYGMELAILPCCEWGLQDWSATWTCKKVTRWMGRRGNALYRETRWEWVRNFWFWPTEGVCRKGQIV